MAEPRIILDKKFVDDWVDLTSCRVERCHFDGCVIELRNEPPPAHIDRCLFTDCRRVGDGWPPGVVMDELK